MKTKQLLSLICLFCIFFTDCTPSWRRSYDPYVDGRGLIIRLDKAKGYDFNKEVLQKIGLEALDPDSLFTGLSFGPYSEEGWQLKVIDDSQVEIWKSISPGNYAWYPKGSLFDAMYPDEKRKGSKYRFGVNQWRSKASITMSAPGEATFTLKGYTDAKRVNLSGSFNKWNTLASAMLRDEEGWHITLPLDAGVHVYKFLIDDFNWIADPENLQFESDGHGGIQSLYSVENVEFKLMGYSNARKVYLAGSFNNWNPNQLPLKFENDGWRIPLYLENGTHSYKFIVDGEWITDPANPVVRSDGQGNLNSELGIGTPVLIKLPDFMHAEKVYIAGSFNQWNFSTLAMMKNLDGWELNYVLSPGNYEYKFLIDKEFLPDPNNPHQTGEAPYINSILAVNPSYTFKLSGFDSAQRVAISGDFNQWADRGYSMVYSKGAWQIALHLPAGKHRYKFIVDNQWILDPANPYYEDNEYGTGNSVLWID